MKIVISLIYTVIVLSGIILIPSAFAENVPDWVKNNAGWWATDQIDDSSFIQGIQYLIKEGIMVIPPSETSESTASQVVPAWIKNNAGWWADGLIDDSSFVLGMQWLVSNGIIIVEDKLIHTDANFRVAFIADQGIKPTSIAVLNLIKDEGAHMVLHQGDLYYEIDYRDTIDPDAWEKMISDVLGDDFPYFITIGGHDVDAWDEYQQMAYDRLKKNPDAKCTGDLGIKSFCTYRGLSFIQVSPSFEFYEKLDHNSFIENNLNNNDHLWRVCSWQGNMHEMQIGAKKDSTGWEVYENCKNHGAIIATAEEHSYHRTKTMIDIENQIVDPEWPKPDKLKVEEGSTFVFVSGLGGWSIRDQERCLPTSYPYGCNGEWANIYTIDQDANFGALFCTFNVGGQPNKAYCYFKNIDGRIVDAFTITNFLGTYSDNTNHLNFDKSGMDLTGDDLSNSVIIDANLSNTILVDADLSNSVLIGTTFRGADLTGANLAGIILNGKDLTGSILRGADLTGANLDGIDLSDMDLTGTTLRGADLSNSILTGVYLSGKDLTSTKFAGVDLSDHDLTGSILREADLTGANLDGIDLSDMDLTDVILRGVDLTNNDLTGSILRGADLTGANLDGIDLSDMDLTGTTLRGADLSNSILTGVYLSGKDLTRTKLVGVDLSDHDLTETILREADLTGATLPSDYLSGNNFRGAIGHMTIFDEVNLSGKDLSYSDFEYTSFKNTNLKNANLSYAVFLAADLTDANLAGADLSGTSFAFANLSGVNPSGAILEQTNFHNADLTGLDFTGVFNNFIYGGHFPNADLFNSNFEGVILSPQEFFTTVFKNKASAINLEGEAFLEKLFCGEDGKCSGFPKIHIISKKASGNDLVVEYLFFNNFREANLENANFKNAGLVLANFLNANLTNADLSGADLRKSLLEGANLEGANLEGANLEGATLDNAILSNANLRCVNHPICVSG